MPSSPCVRGCPSSPSLPSRPPPTAVRPAAPGFSAERLARIAPVMEQLIRDGRFPGVSVTVARNGRVAYQQEFGFADVAKKTPLRKDTIYRVFSMSKPVTGVAVMMLVEEGRLVLDDPVSRYIPCFKNLQVFDGEGPEGPVLKKADREVTVRDLLRHTSGFGYGGNADPVARLYQAKNVMDSNAGLDQMVERACTVPLRFQPGTKWEYSISMDILGRLVEVVSGQALDAFFQTRIFDPLKMVDTGFFVPEAKAARFANCYNYAEGKGLTPVPPAVGRRSLHARQEQAPLGRRRPRVHRVRLPPVRDDAGARRRTGRRAAPRTEDGGADVDEPVAGRRDAVVVGRQERRQRLRLHDVGDDERRRDDGLRVGGRLRLGRRRVDVLPSRSEGEARHPRDDPADADRPRDPGEGEVARLPGAAGPVEGEGARPRSKGPMRTRRLLPTCSVLLLVAVA